MVVKDFTAVFSSWTLSKFFEIVTRIWIISNHVRWNWIKKCITYYQGKFDSILDNLRNNFDEPKGKFTRLESNLITSKLNSKLSDRLLNLERESFANEQYSRRACLEISGILPSLKDNKLESKVLNTLEEIDAPIGPGLVENCHRLPSKGNPEAI